MRILLINHYAGSERMGMEYRPFYLAREWINTGHDPIIIAADFSHVRSRQPNVMADLETTEEENIRFHWLRTGSYTGNGIGRVRSMAAFAGKLYAYAARIAREHRPDVVICSSTYPLDIYAGARIACAANARLVFEVHDLWPLTPMLLGGYSARHPYIRLLQHAEDWAYRHAHGVISILPHARDYMVRRGLDPRKFAHVPNGVSLTSRDAAVLPPPLAALISRERARGRFLVGYAGSLTLSNSVWTLLDVSRRLTGAGVALFIVGDGPASASLREQAKKLQLDNFHMPGRIAKSAVPEFLARMDALTIAWRHSPLYQFGISPNKLFDYMLAGRPILQASDARNDLVSEAGCGFTVAPEDPGALANAVLRLHAMPESERCALGERGYRFVMRHHDYSVLARQFLDALATKP